MNSTYSLSELLEVTKTLSIAGSTIDEARATLLQRGYLSNDVESAIIRTYRAWEVHVSNIGAVYSGNSETEARKDYSHYCALSSSGYGRVANEDVMLVRDGDVIEEQLGDYEDIGRYEPYNVD